MSERIFHLTPPLRKAIVELVRAYSAFKHAEDGSRHMMIEQAKRLSVAQDTIGIQIVKDPYITAVLIRETIGVNAA